jgi:rare lipoprotein A
MMCKSLTKYNFFAALKLACLLLSSVFLFACSVAEKKEQDAAPSKPVDWSQVRPVVPKNEPKSRYGNPDSYEIDGITYRVMKSAKNFRQEGVASWYGTKFHGRRTSSGEPYDMLQLTAAHKTLPIPCYVKVTNKDNGKELIVKVNDRGPFAKSRIIDLSYAAAHKLGMAHKGTANVVIQIIDFEDASEIGGKAEATRNGRANEPLESSKKRFVQVGAYSNKNSAQKLLRVLDREIDLPVSLSTILRAGKKLHRVRIGPIPNLEIAQELAKTLDIAELGKPSIVYQD